MVSTHYHLIQQTFKRSPVFSPRRAAAAVVTMDTDMDTTLRDRLVRKRIHNNVESEGHGASNLFNMIRDNKRIVECLCCFKLIHQ